MKKHIVCYGDSNTHGYCAADDGRFNENERWETIISYSRKDYPAAPPALTIRSTRDFPDWIIFIHAL